MLRTAFYTLWILTFGLKIISIVIAVTTIIIINYISNITKANGTALLSRDFESSR